MATLHLVALVLHVLCACVWIGGGVFFVGFIRLISGKPDFREVRARLLYAYAMTYRPATYALLALLASSGAFLLYHRGLWGYGLWRDGDGPMAALKLALFVALAAAQAFHDFIIGPRSFLADGDGVAIDERHRRANRMIGQAGLLLSLALLVTGVLLSRGVSFF